MKKRSVTAVITVFAMALSLSACAERAQEDENVIVRESEPASFAGCAANCGCGCSNCFCDGEAGTAAPETDTAKRDTGNKRDGRRNGSGAYRG